ncbi:MAG: RAMP superfamily CRISPR-associated protein [Pseudomonadota bacterium]
MFCNRIEIIGKIVVEQDSPLHIGSGEWEARTGIRSGDSSDEVTVAKVVRARQYNKDGSFADLPCIPGSTLKHALRNLCVHEELANDLFGYSTEPRSDDDEGQRQMGRLLVETAALTKRGNARHRPHGDSQEGTFIDARTRIDPDWGVAHKGDGAGGQLYHLEMVAPGAEFAMRLRLLGDLEPAEFESLVEIFNQLAAGTQIGKGTKACQGRIRLVPDSLTVTRHWLDPNGRWQKEAIEHDLDPPEKLIPATACLRLACRGPYLTIDSSHEHKSRSGDPQIVGLCDENGGPVVRPTGVLGALRARCRWLSNEADDCTKVLGSRDDPKTELTSVERLFGVTGWRSCVQTSALEMKGDARPFEFTSVGLDRFTSGPIEGRLFTVKAHRGFGISLSLALENRNNQLTEADRALFDQLVEDIERNGLMLGAGQRIGFGWFEARKPERPKVADVLRTWKRSEAPKLDAKDEESIRAFKRGAKSPYRMVPINPTFYRSPIQEGCHARSLPSHVSATINMAWIAESPLLIGVKGKDDVVRSFSLAMNSGELLYSLPGSSLRGMVRAVFEIATESKLTPLDEKAKFDKRSEAYSLSTIADQTQSDRKSTERDVTEMVFGYVDQEDDELATDEDGRQKSDNALKGRVFFETALCLNNELAREFDPLTTILGGPKGKFPPFYLNGPNTERFDWTSPVESIELAGRKRYPVRNRHSRPRSVPKSDVTSTLAFLDTSDSSQPLVFSGRIKVHNLSLFEFGALLWALTFGGREATHRHMMGRGRAFGYGQFALRLASVRDDAGGVISRDQCATYMKLFEQSMDKRDTANDRPWSESDGISELLATADPRKGEIVHEHLDYPGDFRAYNAIKQKRPGDEGRSLKPMSLLLDDKT